MQLAVEEESKQKTVLNKDLERIRTELQQSIDEKHQFQSQIHALIEENNRFREFTGKSASELECVTSKAIALEVWGLLLNSLPGP